MRGKWNLFIDYSHRICDVYYAYLFPDASLWDTYIWGNKKRSFQKGFEIFWIPGLEY